MVFLGHLDRTFGANLFFEAGKRRFVFVRGRIDGCGWRRRRARRGSLCADCMKTNYEQSESANELHCHSDDSQTAHVAHRNSDATLTIGTPTLKQNSEPRIYTDTTDKKVV